MLGEKDYKEICKEIEKLETNHPDGHIDYNTCNMLHVLYKVRNTYEKELKNKMGVTSPKAYKEDKEAYNKPLYMLKDEDVVIDENDSESELMKIVNIYGAKKVILSINEYMDHERRWNPVNYSKMIDFIKDKC